MICADRQASATDRRRISAHGVINRRELAEIQRTARLHGTAVCDVVNDGVPCVPDNEDDRARVGDVAEVVREPVARPLVVDGAEVRILGVQESRILDELCTDDRILARLPSRGR